VDPQAARSILPSNGRRLVRALEVVELTGRPFAARLPRPTAPAAATRVAAATPAAAVQIGLDRADLDDRVATRVERMWERGLVAEARGLPGLAGSPTASRALGYQQVLRLLAGELTDAEARAETVRATRRFVRRQRSWFRRDPRITWLDAARGDLADAAARTLDP
jgi:tRNA dimethylallyltransferase